ncbi:MAG: AAA family ATPase [Planctomycetaceae bacterium]
MAVVAKDSIMNFTSHRIRSISIVGGFLDGARFDLTDGLNCFIGARGAGQTTVIEFVRYALDALPSRDEQPIERRRIESLVEKNLAGGRVEVEIETRDGVTYTVSRAAGEEPIVLSAEGVPTEVSLRGGAVFQAAIYSQNEIEGIANRPAAQLDLLDRFDPERINELASQIDHTESLLVTNASQVIPLQGRLSGLREELATLVGVDDKLAEFAEVAGQDSSEVNAAHTLKGLRDREQRVVLHTQQALQELQRQFEQLDGSRSPSWMDPDLANAPNLSLVQQIQQALSSCRKDLEQLLNSARERIRTALAVLVTLQRNLQFQHQQQEQQFRAVVERHQHAQGQLAERTKLERRRNELRSKQGECQALEERIHRLQAERGDHLRRLSELRDQRWQFRSQIAEYINQHLNPVVRVTVAQQGNPEVYRRLLEDSLKHARIKQGQVATKLIGLWPADLVQAIRTNDLTSLIQKAGLNVDQAEKVLATLSQSPALLDIEKVELKDHAKIELLDGQQYKDSLSLSTGQKCTTILPILLLFQGVPLLIDQPEDNLDNRFITVGIVDNLRKAKQHRQIIFVTHNPNIPVLGDADRVFVLDSDGSQSRKANEGTVEQCKSEIVTLLEGGEDAFKARQSRYAY